MGRKFMDPALLDGLWVLDKVGVRVVGNCRGAWSARAICTARAVPAGSA